MTLRLSAFAALSGAMLAVAFPTFDLHLLAWIALVPLFLALSGNKGPLPTPGGKGSKKNPQDNGSNNGTAVSVKTGFLLGGLTGLVYFTGTVYWVTNSIHYYGGISLIPASLITLLLASYLALYPALFGAAAVSLRKNYPSLFFLTAPALWTALELARTYVFSGFPWSLLGYTQYSTLPVIQIADITGVYGVSFVIVLVNAAVSEFILDRKKYAPLLAAAIVMIAVLGYGFFVLRQPDGTEGITVSVVQGNIEQDKKWDRVYQQETSAVYRRLTGEALRNHPDLVIWPETATPFYFTGQYSNDRRMSKELIDYVKQIGTPLLFGSPTYEVLPNRRIIGRNSAFLATGDGTVAGTYHKIHLVPFGEYVPMKRVLFFIDKMVEAIGDFRSGGEYVVMPVPVRDGIVRMSTPICYEIIFPDLVRRFVDRGAEVITTVTNDAWFGRTAAPYQHFSMAIFRAVENRVPVARAANTGISGFVDAKGHILATSDIFTEAELTRTLVPGTTKTFYTRHGDLFSYLCLIITMVMLVKIPKKAEQ